MQNDGQSTISLTFLCQCRNAIETMRQAGINDTLISCVISDVRSATLNEEFSRLKRLVETAPPVHEPFGAVLNAMKELER